MRSSRGFAIAARGPGAECEAFQPGAGGIAWSGWRLMPGRGRARCWRGSGSMRCTGCGRRLSRSCRWGSRRSRARPTRYWSSAIARCGCRMSRFIEVVDLAEAWHRLTGLPFVFAFWVARGGVELGELPAALERSRALGLAAASSLARIHGPRLGLDVTHVLRLLDASSVLRPRRARARRAEAICRHGGPPRPGAGRSEPCLPPRPRSCTAPLTAIA